jgi:adenylate cyclase
MDTQLAAVLAADVVGYSTMMGEDAAGTVKTLRRLRSELFGPMVAGHKGKVVKSMGDGWIVTFRTASDAVTCAMRLQDKMVLEPDIKIRIGLHIGDVSVAEEDVFGEGVNVAARLEALTEPGGVSLSDAVYSTLDGTLRPAFDDAGERDLKNITKPVRVWVRGGIVGATLLRDSVGRSGFPALNIVTAKPPAGAGPDMTEEAFALTHDLERHISPNRMLRVTVGDDPLADAWNVQSSFRLSGSRFRLLCRLTDPEGTLVWSDTYDNTLDSLFDWHDETVLDISGRMIASLIDTWCDAVEAMPEASRQWEDWIILSARTDFGGKSGVLERVAHARAAIAKTPTNSLPYELLLVYSAAASSLGHDEIVGELAKDIPEWIEKARRLPGAGLGTRAALAFSHYVRTGDVRQAHADVAAVLRDLPFDPEALTGAGFVYQFTGEPQKALECFQRFDVVGRYHIFQPGVRSGTAAAYVQLGRYEDALPHSEAAIRLSPEYVAAHRWRIAALAQLGRLDEARDLLAAHDRILPGMTIASVREGSHYVDTPETARYFDGLRLAGMPEG